MKWSNILCVHPRVVRKKHTKVYKKWEFCVERAVVLHILIKYERNVLFDFVKNASAKGVSKWACCTGKGSEWKRIK